MYIDKNKNRIEYVESTWLHIHFAHGGMFSIHLEEENFEEFYKFIFQYSNGNEPLTKEVSEKFLENNKYAIVLEYIGEDDFNILFSSGELSFVYTISRKEISKMLKEIRN